MKYLTNLANSEKVVKWFNKDWLKIREFMNRNHLDGVELMLGGQSELGEIDKHCVTGMHLKYWPIWLDFWQGNQLALIEQFGNIENIELFYGGLDKNALIDHYKREWDIAQRLEVEYVVFHVAHVELLDTYTWDFKYRDWDVLEATIELVNKSFGNKDQGIKLLFENLWWPGLKLTDYSLAKAFIEEIDYPNKGFMLDIGHLMITDAEIKNEEEACNYISSIIDELQELKKYIKGIHLNKSLSGDYLRENWKNVVLELKNVTNFWDRLDQVGGHINKIDRHIPFDYSGINKIIKDIEPEYLVLEFLSSNLAELEGMLAYQRKFLK